MGDEERRKVFVGYDLPKYVHEQHLLSHFSEMRSEIVEVTIAKGYGAVVFTTADAAKAAIARYNGTLLLGQIKIKVKPFRSPARSTERRSRLSSADGGERQRQQPESPPLPRHQDASPPGTLREPRLHPRRGRRPILPPSDPQPAVTMESRPSARAQVREPCLVVPPAPTPPTRKSQEQQDEGSRLPTSTCSPEGEWPDLVVGSDTASQDSTTASHILAPFSIPASVRPPTTSSSNGVVITNLSSQLDEDDLIPFLGSGGKLISLITTNDARGIPTKIATVHYPTLADAEEAIHNWHGKSLFGQLIYVHKLGHTYPPPLQIPHATPTVSTSSYIPGLFYDTHSPSTFPMLSQPTQSNTAFTGYSASFPKPVDTRSPALALATIQPIAAVTPTNMSALGGGLQIAHDETVPLKPCLLPKLVHTVPASTQPPRYQVGLQKSPQFWEFLLSAASQHLGVFRQSGGTLDFYDDCLHIQAHTAEAAEEFVKFIDDQFTEYPMHLTVKQWNQLMELRSDGTCQFNELTAPFCTNPNVKIWHNQGQGVGGPAIIFTGRNEAVFSAHTHFMSTLSKEMEISRMQAAALQQMHSKFSSLLGQHQVKVSFTDTSLSFEGRPNSIKLARDKVEQILSLLQLGQVPSFTVAALLPSLRKRLQMEQVDAYIVHLPPDAPCLAALSTRELQQAKEIAGALFWNKHSLSSEDLTRQLQSSSNHWLTKLQRDHSVTITIEAGRVVVCGYVKEDVTAAADALSMRLKQISAIKRPLECPPAIHTYLLHVLFKQPTMENRSFVRSLSVRITVDENSQIQLEGTPADISEGEKQLLSHFVPPELKHRTFKFTCESKFFFLVENTVLKRLHEEATFLHTHQARLPAHHQRKGNQRQGSPSHSPSSTSEEEASFSITIYSKNAEHFENVCAELQGLNPHTEKIPIHPSAIEYLRKQKSGLEQKHCVQLAIHTTQPTHVSIDGLRDEDIANCQTELEETLFVRKDIPVSGFQMVYLEQRFSQKIEELKQRCRKFSPPRVSCDNQQSLAGNHIIVVVGKSADVEHVEKEIQEILTDDFKREVVAICCKEEVFSLWEKRWKKIKLDLEESHNIVIQFDRSSSPRVSQTRSSTSYSSVLSTAQLVKKVVVNFVIFGSDPKCVDEVRRVISEVENGEVLEEELTTLSDQETQSLRAAITSKELDISDLMVQVQLRLQRKLLLQAPCSVEEDFLAAKTLLQNFIDKIVTKNKVIPCSNKMVGLVLVARSGELLKKANSVAKENKAIVSFQRSPPAFIIRGSQSGIGVVQACIETLLGEIKAGLGVRQVAVELLLRPFFLSKEYSHFCSRLERNHQVVVKCPIVETGNTVLRQMSFQPKPTSLCVQLSIIQGDILKEDVEVIVNAANGELNHIGGLAKVIADAGGASIQEESTLYIKDHGKLKAGDVVCLSAGDLPCQKIIHAVGPQWRQDQDEKYKLYLAIYNSLCAAEKEGLQSIALPAISTGVFSVPENVCADASHVALTNFCSSFPRGCVKDVRFVLYTETAVQAFLSEFKSEGSSAQATFSEAFPPLSQLAERQEAEPAVAHPTSFEVQSPVTWLWKNDAGSFSPYDSSTCQLLTKQYRSNPQGSYTISVSSRQYRVDFTSMIQTNLVTGFTRRVKREVTVLQSPSVEVQWYYRDDRRHYSPYTPHDSAAIEDSYQTSSGPLRLIINGNVYEFDMQQMEQINTRTKYRRSIKRETVPDRHSSSMSASASALSDEEEVNEGSLKLEQITVTITGPKEKLQEAERELREKLKSCVKTDFLAMRRPSKSMKKSLKKVAQRHNIVLEFGGKGQERTATLKGVGSAVEKALIEMQKLVIENIPEESQEIEHPPEWEPQTKTTELFTVQRGSPEWQAVSTKFMSTMHNANITSIRRIQNTWLWKKYVHHKKMIEEKNSGADNEMELFHGTGRNNPREIYDSEEGFDMRFSAKGSWGQANYFAVNASYSDRYAHTNISGEKEMFLAKVLTGDSYHCGSDSSLRMPPPKTSSTGGVQLHQVRYDTVTGYTGGSQVYMTYDNQKAYPSYLIAYSPYSSRLPFF